MANRTYRITRLTERTGPDSSAQVLIERSDNRQCVAKVWSDGSCEATTGARWLLADLRKVQGRRPETASIHRDVSDDGVVRTVEG